MLLREKILIVLLAVLCCYSVVEYVVLKQVIVPELEKHERLHVQNDLQQCVDAIRKKQSDLQQKLSAMNHSGQLYAQTKSRKEYGIASIASDLDLDFLLIYSNDWDRLGSYTDQVAAEPIETLLFDTDRPIIKRNIPGYSHKTLVRHQNLPLQVISAPITRSSLSQSVEGTVIAGQFLNDHRLGTIKNQLQLNFNWDFIDPDQLIGQKKEIVQRISSTEPFDLLPVGEEFLQGSTLLYDCRQEPILMVKTFRDRTASQKSGHTMYLLLFGRIATGAVSVILLTVLLQRVVVKPIVRLSDHIINVEHFGKKGCGLPVSRKDEIGTLATEFDLMCKRLQNAQVKLMEKSYLSGVTEMSSGILHNVRNALSPITTRIERIKGQFKSVPLDNLEQAQTELQNNTLDPERRRDLSRFIDLTFQDVICNLNDMVEGLDDLAGQVFQIEDMLNIQRTFGREDKPVEFIEPTKLLNKALEMVPERVKDECRITVQSEIKELAAIPVEPTSFVQILQNLLINAAESLERQKPLYRKINIWADVETIDDRQMLHWKIQDNGTGIPEEKIQKIFERGSSSKRKGLTGIGLHWCANTLAAMKGQIWAESPGEHRGAEFHILIPIDAEKEQVETVQEMNA